MRSEVSPQKNSKHHSIIANSYLKTHTRYPLSEIMITFRSRNLLHFLRIFMSTFFLMSWTPRVIYIYILCIHSIIKYHSTHVIQCNSEVIRGSYHWSRGTKIHEPCFVEARGSTTKSKMLSPKHQRFPLKCGKATLSWNDNPQYSLWYILVYIYIHPQLLRSEIGKPWGMPVQGSKIIHDAL